eukprot:scaffold17885_cov38-Tisochrysis_lutea.AAC.2
MPREPPGRLARRGALSPAHPSAVRPEHQASAERHRAERWRRRRRRAGSGRGLWWNSAPARPALPLAHQPRARRRARGGETTPWWRA